MADSATSSAAEASDDDLGDLMLEVLPGDGSTIGNQSAELEELPLPYRFDVQALEQIRLAPRLEHIERVGGDDLCRLNYSGGFLVIH